MLPLSTFNSVSALDQIAYIVLCGIFTRETNSSQLTLKAVLALDELRMLSATTSELDTLVLSSGNPRSYCNFYAYNFLQCASC